MPPGAMHRPMNAIVHADAVGYPGCYDRAQSTAPARPHATTRAGWVRGAEGAIGWSRSGTCCGAIAWPPDNIACRLLLGQQPGGLPGVDIGHLVVSFFDSLCQSNTRVCVVSVSFAWRRRSRDAATAPATKGTADTLVAYLTDLGTPDTIMHCDPGTRQDACRTEA